MLIQLRQNEVRPGSAGRPILQGGTQQGPLEGQSRVVKTRPLPLQFTEQQPGLQRLHRVGQFGRGARQRPGANGRPLANAHAGECNPFRMAARHVRLLHAARQGRYERHHREHVVVVVLHHFVDAGARIARHVAKVVLGHLGPRQVVTANVVEYRPLHGAQPMLAGLAHQPAASVHQIQVGREHGRL